MKFNKQDSFFGKTESDVSELEIAARQCLAIAKKLPPRLAMVAQDCALSIRKQSNWSVYK